MQPRQLHALPHGTARGLGEETFDIHRVYRTGRDRDQVLERTPDEVGRVIAEHRRRPTVHRPYRAQAVDDHGAVGYCLQKLVRRYADAGKVAGSQLYGPLVAASKSTFASNFECQSRHLAQPPRSNYMRQESLGA